MFTSSKGCTNSLGRLLVHFASRQISWSKLDHIRSSFPLRKLWVVWAAGNFGNFRSSDPGRLQYTFLISNFLMLEASIQCWEDDKQTIFTHDVLREHFFPSYVEVNLRSKNIEWRIRERSAHNYSFWSWPLSCVGCFVYTCVLYWVGLEFNVQDCWHEHLCWIRVPSFQPLHMTRLCKLTIRRLWFKLSCTSVLWPGS